MLARGIAPIAVLLALLGCDRPRATQVLIHLEAAPALEARAGSLSVVVSSPGGPVVLDRCAVLGADVELPSTIPLSPAGNDPARHWSVEAALHASDACEPERRLARVSAQGRYVAGERREVTLRFDAECEGVLDCPAWTSCRAGRCESACGEPAPEGASQPGSVVPCPRMIEPGLCDPCACEGGFLCEPGSGCGTGEVRVSGLRMDWATSEGIAWSWAVAGGEASFERYALLLAERQEAVEQRCGAMAWGPLEAPELGRAIFNPVELARTGRVLTQGLRPGTTYYARLFAFDLEGAFVATEIASARTAEPRATEAPLFPSGMVRQHLPACFETTSVDGEPTHVYRVDCEGPCPDGERECWRNLKLRTNMTLDGLDPDRFAGAWLAFEVALVGGVPTERGTVYLEALDALGELKAWHLEPFSYRVPEGGGWVRYQVPLAALRDRRTVGSTMFLEDVQGGIVEIAFGARWSAGSEVRIRRVHVAY